MPGSGWVDFGQQERLTVRLKELIRNYPRGVGIIKEFIQNADDAGAKSLSVLLDMRTHPQGRIRDRRMAVLQGPALLIANESVFSEKDFQSIQNIGESSKADSGPKTGRFGLGFNTCYNVTDYPSFVTGGYIVCFDPHQNAIASPGGQHGVRGTLAAVWESSADWLMTFTATGLAQQAAWHEGTIFRLPLRTPAQASGSEISKESFGKDAFDEIVRQLMTVGPELLLFTKHLNAIEVAEISEGADDPHFLLRIATSNPNEVLTARELVHAEMNGNLPDLLPRWRANPDRLPSTTYTHEFTVRVGDEVRQESWRVAHGLFCDPKSELLAAAEAMLGIGEKAVPWAGAAAKLSRHGSFLKVIPIEGRLYCGLPLTDETPLAVHVNGYFDLDSSRRSLSADRNIVGANHVRVDWNELLMRHGAAAAYAKLLVDCASIAQADLAAFYDLFPKLSVTKAQLLSTLCRGVYSHIRQKAVIKATTTTGATWLPVEGVWLSPEQLRDPLVAEGKAVAEPYLPQHIQSGFEANKVPLNRITPKIIRDWLYTDQDIDSNLESAPRPFLSRRHWVEELLQYCLSDQGALKGLPLALLADGKLHTFGYSKAGLIFSASQEQRTIFHQVPHWFIDLDFEQSTGLKEQRQSGFCRMLPSEVIANLGAILGKDSVNDVVHWQPNAVEAPNSEWLTVLFNYLASVPRPELQKSAANLQQWPLIPDQHNQLHPFRGDSLPVFRPDEPIYRKLVASLDSLDVSFITGTPALLDSIRRFAAAHPTPALAALTGLRLASILNTNQKLRDNATSYDAKLHDPILNFLVEDRFVTAYAEPALKLMRSIPILPTTSGSVVEATAPDLFVPDYKPPTCSPSVVLLRTGPDHHWRKLLHKLGIPRLDRRTLIEKVLIPKYSAQSAPDQVDMLKWIRDHLTQEVNRLDRLENGLGEKLLTLVRKSDLVRCTNGELHCGARIYDPREKMIRDVLGDRVPIPDQQVYSSTDPSWLSFFELLGMAKTPRAQDLLEYIDSLILAAQKGTARVSRQLIDVFEFIQENWSSLSSASINDSNGLVNFAAALKNRAWLPAQRNPKTTEEFPGFTFQQDRLYRPTEIYPLRLIHQIGSVLPVLPTSRDAEREFRLALDMPSQAPMEAVCRHFDYLIDLWSKPDQSGIKPERIGLSFREIYRFFGAIANELEEHPERGDLAVALQVLKARYQGRCCIWDAKALRLWKPLQIFMESVPFFEPRRTRIVYTEDRVNAGLAALGRGMGPVSEDYLGFLNDLRSEFGRTPLPESEQKQVIYSLRYIADSESEIKSHNSLPLLSRDASLSPANELLWEDTIRFRDKIDLSQIPIVHDQAPPSLIASAGVRRLSDHLIEELVSEPEATRGHGLEKLCRQISTTIRAAEFSMGLRRLLRHQTGIDQVANSDIISGINVVASASITTEVTLHLDARTMDLGTCNATSFFRASDSTLFVTGSSERQVLIALAKAINGLMEPRSLLDLSALMEILKAVPSAIDGVLNDYEVPRIDTAEPEEIKYEDSGRYEDFGIAEEPDSLGTDEAEAEESTPLEDFERTVHDTAETPASDDTGRRPPIVPAAQQSRRTTQEKRSGGSLPRTPYGSDDKPPIVPGSGKTPWESTVGPGGADRQAEPTRRQEEQSTYGSGGRSRIVTYVEGSQSRLSEAADGSSDAGAVGVAAIGFVLDFEKRNGRSPKAMDHNNEGFDVLSEGPQGQVRYIEVKGVDGEWDMLGVGLTRAQFKFAQTQGSRFWLYVVENARSASPTPYLINDPVSLIMQYRFDAGWKDLADDFITDTHARKTPTEGMRVTFIQSTGNTASGTITKVERKGLLVRLHIRTDAGLEVKQFLSASMNFSEGVEERQTNAADAPRVE